MIYYISDLHLGDSKVFKKCSRPFKDLNEMKDAIASNWNAIVKEEDTVWLLGDLTGDEAFDSVSVLKTMKGRKNLIIGNHDYGHLEESRNSGLFETINFITLIDDNKRKVCLCHYPIMDWMEFNRNGMLVYGHIHNKTETLNGRAYRQIKEYYADKSAYNCGVDVTGFRPVTLDQMIELKEKNRNEPFIN